MATKKQEKQATLLERLLAIREGVSGLAKDARNEHFRFDYVSSSKVLGKLRKLMNENRVLLIPNIESIAYSTSGKNIFTEVNIKYTWVNVDDSSDSLECNWYAQGQDSGEKGPGKAYTYAEKYFLLKFFNIPTDRDDPDASAAPEEPADPTQGAMSDEQGKELQARSKELYGANYKESVRALCDGVGAHFPPKSIQDYVLLKAEMNSKAVVDAAKDLFDGQEV